MTKSNVSRANRPEKPYPTFPLFPHASGRWAKKVRGKFAYFGKVADDPKGEAAYRLWQEQEHDLRAGRTPRPSGDGLTTVELVNRFLTAKKRKADTGELSGRTFADYHRACGRVINAFGRTRLVSDLGTDDFSALRSELAKTLGPVAIGNEVQRIRVLFKFAKDNRGVEVSFGSEFKRPSRKVLRRARREKGRKMFEAAQLRRILAAAEQPLRAMILLGINCGFGNADVGTIPIGAVDLQRGWVNYHRPKTEIERRCPLWPETVAAIREWLKGRPAPKDAAFATLLFLTRCGTPWHKGDGKLAIGDVEGIEAKALNAMTDNPVAKEMVKLLKTVGLHRPGLAFYALRHTFETVGGETRDQVAVDAIMGHDRGDMASVYREKISDERLKVVTNYVHDWLFPPKAKTQKKTGDGKGNAKSKPAASEKAAPSRRRRAKKTKGRATAGDRMRLRVVG